MGRMDSHRPADLRPRDCDVAVAMRVLIDGVPYMPKPAYKPGGNLADALVTARARTGETLAEVADAIGTTKSHVWSMEHGGTQPRLPMLKKIMAHYALRFEDVCG